MKSLVILLLTVAMHTKSLLRAVALIASVTRVGVRAYPSQDGEIGVRQAYLPRRDRPVRQRAGYHNEARLRGLSYTEARPRRRP